MNGTSLFKLLTKNKQRRQLLVMHIVGTVLTVLGCFLYDIGKGNPWMALTGLILWAVAERGLLTALKEDIEGCKG